MQLLNVFTTLALATAAFAGPALEARDCPTGPYKEGSSCSAECEGAHKCSLNLFDVVSAPLSQSRPPAHNSSKHSTFMCCLYSIFVMLFFINSYSCALHIRIPLQFALLLLWSSSDRRVRPWWKTFHALIPDLYWTISTGWVCRWHMGGLSALWSCDLLVRELLDMSFAQFLSPVGEC